MIDLEKNLKEFNEFLEENSSQLTWSNKSVAWKVWQKKQSEIDELKAKLRNYEIYSNQLLTERDEIQEFAEQLKDRLQEVFNQDFGDHSNANCPFTNALEYDDSGFVLMPKEPNEEIIKKMWRVYLKDQHMSSVYKAMIKAAQEKKND